MQLCLLESFASCRVTSGEIEKDNDILVLYIIKEEGMILIVLNWVIKRQQDTDGDKGQEQEEKSVYPAQDMVSQRLSMCQWNIFCQANNT
jgi:hypothetical protein